MATLAEMRTRARQLADMELGPGQSEANHFITDSELNDYVNDAISDLYDIITDEDQDSYLESGTFETATDTQEYSLPEDFYEFKALERKQSIDDYDDIRKFTMKDRNKVGLSYRIRGANIRFNRFPDAVETYRYWYLPKPQTLELDSDEFDGRNRWEEYVVVTASIKMLQKEESDTLDLERRQAYLEARVRAKAARLDNGNPDTIGDETRWIVNDYGWERFD